MAGAALVLCLWSLPRSAGAALLGDVNGDGQVTVQDALELLHGIGLGGLFTGRELILSGANRAKPGIWPLLTADPASGSASVSFQDIRAILRCAVGLERPTDLGPVVVTIAGSGPTRLEDPLKLKQQNKFIDSDGPAEHIRLFDPWDIALGPSGTVYFIESLGNRVRKIDAQGMVRTIAGTTEPGFKDGQGRDARFQHPKGIALLPDGSLVIGDTDNHAIRRVTPGGQVTTLAGAGRPGYQDGTGAAARFWSPEGVATDPAGHIYVADSSNNRIRKVDPDGAVTTLAGSSSRQGYTDGPALQAKFYCPSGLLYDTCDGGLYIADQANNAIRKLTADGQVITLAGSGARGHADGRALQAEFFRPYGMALDAQGRLWIADWLNEAIRRLDPDGQVVTVAGGLPDGYTNGPMDSVKFRGLMNVRVAPNGYVYIADTDNERIRVLEP